MRDLRWRMDENIGSVTDEERQGWIQQLFELFGEISSAQTKAEDETLKKKKPTGKESALQCQRKCARDHLNAVDHMFVQYTGIGLEQFVPEGKDPTEWEPESDR